MTRTVTITEEERVAVLDASCDRVVVTSAAVVTVATIKTVERLVIAPPAHRLTITPAVERVTVSGVGVRGEPGPAGPPGTGGGGGAGNVFIQATAPVTALATYLWVQTFANGDLSFWVEDNA